MSKGFRALLHTFQVLCLLGALLFMVFILLMTYFDFGGTEQEKAFVAPLAMGLGILSIAFSPALWSLHRGGENAGTAMGGHGRVGEQPPVAAPRPPHPGAPGGFEPLNAEHAPAPPSSSYSQPSGPNFGAQPSGGMPPTSPPQGDSPWGGPR